LTESKSNNDMVDDLKCNPPESASSNSSPEVKFDPYSIELKGTNFADYLPQGIRIIDLNKTIMYINKAFAELSGASSDKIIGKKCWEVFTDPYCHTSECCLEKIRSGQASVQVEIERIKPDGTRVPCMLSAFPLYAPNKQLIGMMESFRDITEKRRLEADVQEAQQLYQAMIELTGEIGESVLMLQDINGQEGNIIFASDQFARLTGYPKKAILGKSIFKLIKTNERKTALERHRLKMVGESLPGLYKMHIMCKDGSYLRVELTSAVTRYKGQPANVVYLRDITERNLHEKELANERDKYKSFFQNSPIVTSERNFSEVKRIFDSLRKEGVTNFRQYFHDNPEMISYCLNRSKLIAYNKALIEAYEANGPEEIIRMVNQSLHDKTEFWQMFYDVLTNLAEGKCHFQNEEIVYTIKGKRKNVNLITIIAPGYEDTLSRVYLSFFDITELRQAQIYLQDYQKHLEDMVNKRTSELASAHQELKEQFENRIQFTRALIHELKTFITPLISASELLSQQIKDGSLKTLTNTIGSAVIGLEHRIDDLLDLAKGEIGRLEVHRINLQPDELLEKVANYAANMAEINEQKFEYKIPSSLPLLWADEERLMQILLNLLNNAFKFTPKGGTILLKSWANSENLFIRVVDNGPGIPAEMLPKIFKSYQLRVAERRVSSLGIGLPLAKMLAELHEGQIKVESQKGKGSNFTLILPLKK